MAKYIDIFVLKNVSSLQKLLTFLQKIYQCIWKYLSFKS